MQIQTENSTPEETAARIFEIRRHKIDPKLAPDLWSKILQHKWVLSEKMGRDIGIKVACIDFIENIDSLEGTLHDVQKINQLNRMGGSITRFVSWGYDF